MKSKKEFAIKHPRFKKKTYLKKKNPFENTKYFNFFENYAKERYTLIKTFCLCGIQSDITLSEIDRHLVSFEVVICMNCGLIRAESYMKNEDVIDFYSKHYRDITSNITRNDIDKLWYEQVEDSKVQFKLIEKFKTENLINSLIIDVGGGVGGALSHFDESNDRVLLDYSEQHLNYATSKNIRAIKGGLESFEQKADVVILSHVIEHWNDFQEQIKSLVKIQKIRKTLNYIEFPGVDSLKEGRRGGDLLGDIHIPHFYYFSMCVFENLMNRNGFEKIYMDSEIRAVFIFTGIR
jgi:hypothetical protein